MLIQRAITFVFIVVLLVFFIPVMGWTGPTLLTDEDMDGIYAQGIWVNFEINLALPGGKTFALPTVTLPEITIPHKPAVNSGATTGDLDAVAIVPASAPTSATPVAESVSQVPGVVERVTVSDPMFDTVASNSGSINSPTSSGGGEGVPVTVTTPVQQDYNSLGPGITITDNAMQGNSGLIINAPNSAVSMTISVVVLNNSTVGGDILQSAASYPTNLFFSFKSYMQ